MSQNRSADQIESIVVRGLFGHLDYDIELENGFFEGGDLLIIYGENGTGKTTILRLLFFLLAGTGQGHRRAMLSYRFNSFAVIFKSGKTVKAFREAGKDEGPFDIEFCGVLKSKVILAFREEEGRFAWKDDQRRVSLAECLKSVGCSLYFLPDDRKVLSSARATKEVEGSFYQLDLARSTNVWAKRAQAELGADRHHLQVKPLLEELIVSFRRQAFQGSTIADENASTIYLRVCKQISSLFKAVDQPVSETEKLLQLISDIDEKSQKLARYGLLASFPAKQFEDLFSGASPEDLLAMQKVLQPYIEGLQARIQRLQPLYLVLNTFVTALNEFFSRKIIQASMSNGFSFRSQWGEEISHDQLSSGERQLVLLLGNSILAQQSGSSVFLIDEPELSLNVTWQRQLISALLASSQGNVQFIVASHSLELITKFRPATFRLVPKMA